MRKIKFNIIQIVIVGMFIAISTGCISLPESTPTPFPYVPDNLADRSILTSIPCTAPCWNNLIPDKSSTQEALEVLTNITFIDPADIIIRTANWPADSKNGDDIQAILIRGLCVQPAQTECVEILVVGDKVKQISIFPNYKLPFEEVVSHWGGPDYMQSNPYGAECAGCMLSLYWSKYSATLTSYDKRCVEGGNICATIHDGGIIPHGFVVQEIIYSGSVPAYVEDWNKNSRMPWTGFESP
jgi:hypothetical protein